MEMLLLEKAPDLAFITEANLLEMVPEYSRHINGYSLILPKTMAHLKYSRIVLLVRNGVEVEVLNNCMEPDISAIWIKVGKAGRKPLVVGGVYREQHLLLQGNPNLTDAQDLQNDRWNRTLKGWIKATKNSKSMVLGDMNLNYLHWDNPPYNKNMIDSTKTQIETLGFTQMIREVTRSWPGKEDSIVDHFWTNDPDRVISLRNQVRAHSDHNMISTILRMKDKIVKKQEIRSRCWKKMDIKRVKEKAKNLVWDELLLSTDINEINDILVSNILSILNIEAPMRTVQVRKNFKNWVSEDLKIKLKERDDCREKARKSGDENDWTLYKRKRNDCTRETKKTKNDFYKNLFENLQEENDSKKIHRITKNLLGWDNDLGPKKFLSQGKLIRSPKELANLQLKHYEDKVNTLITNLQKVPGTPGLAEEKLLQALESWPQRTLIPKFKFRKISILETSRIVSELSNSTSCGQDEIDSNFIKLILPSLLIPINHLVNTSLSTSTFANKWRISQIHPLLKDKDLNQLDPGSYRPVSMLSTLSKITERAAQLQLLQFMENTGQINNNGHAYRKGMSTTTAIAEMSDELHRATECRKITSIMTLDQSSAFDMINVEILLRKMKLYNVDDEAIQWFRNYLTYRTRYVTIGASNSNMRPTTRGVPQGSVLGPLLYVMYTNELTEVTRDTDCREEIHSDKEYLFDGPCTQCGMTTTFADDTTYQISNKHRAQNQIKLDKNLKELNTFMRNNELSMNQGKTKILECMISQKKGRTPGPPPELKIISTDGTQKIVLDTGNLRILGANLMSNMNWGSHLQTGTRALLPAARRMLGSLKHQGANIPKACRKLLASTMVMSKLTYLMPIWGGTTPNNIRQAQILQNSTARWVTGMKRRTRIKDLISACGWLTIRETIEQHTVVMMWKMLHQNTPKHLSRKLVREEDFKIRQEGSRLQFTERSLLQRGTKHWNTLPLDLREISTLSIFKRRLKNWIRSRRDQEPD